MVMATATAGDKGRKMSISKRDKKNIRLTKKNDYILNFHDTH